MHVHLTTKHWTKAGHPNLAMAITVTLTMATVMTIRDINIMAMMAMATWVKSPCLTRWRGPPESPLELDRGCDIKREGLFVWMANGYLLLLVIVVCFLATIWYYWLSTLQVDRPFSPDMHRIWSEDLKEIQQQKQKGRCVTFFVTTVGYCEAHVKLSMVVTPTCEWNIKDTWIVFLPGLRTGH